MMNSQVSPPVAAEFTRAKVIPRADYRALQDCVSTALEILEVCIATVRQRPDLQRMAVANHRFADDLLQFVDDRIEAIARFDAFVDIEGTLRFLEYNPGLCGGAFNSYRAAASYLDSRDGRRLSAASRLEAVPTPAYFADAVVEAARDVTGREVSTVALIWPDEPPAETPREMAAFAAELAPRGSALLMLAGSQVERRGGGLWAGGHRIDAAFVMDWEAMGLEANVLAAPLAETWIANTIGSGVFRGGKYLYAVMSDPSLGAPLSPQQRAWVDRHIPWTRMLPRGDAPGAAAEDLRRQVRERQRELIIKPSLGRGGAGVLAGWAVSENQWRDAILSPSADSYLVQERVFPQMEAAFDNRGPPGESVFADLCMFVWGNRRAEGIVSRASRGWLLNVSAGEAKAVPVLVQD